MTCPKCKKDTKLTKYAFDSKCTNRDCVLKGVELTYDQNKYIKNLLDGLRDCLELAELRGDAEQIEKLENILK